MEKLKLTTKVGDTIKFVTSAYGQSTGELTEIKTMEDGSTIYIIKDSDPDLDREYGISPIAIEEMYIEENEED